MISASTGWLPWLWLWMLTGLALDAALLAIFWIFLAVLGPFSFGMASWLEILAIVAVAWHIHVIVLPKIFHLRNFPVASLSWVWRTFVVMVAAALFVPVLGVLMFYMIFNLFLIPLYIVTGGGIGHAAVSRLGQSIDLLASEFVFVLTATLVAAATAVVLTGFRPISATKLSQPMPHARADLLGGMAAGSLSFVGAFATAPLGLWSKIVTGPDEFHPLAVPPPIWVAVVIGTLALFPHLLLLGREELLKQVLHEGAE